MLKDVDTSDPALTQVPVSPPSIRISKDLKKRGFKFVGPTTIQAFLQATGLYRAHDKFCFKNN
jgi:DNA-3-methyladenine glycosylase I